MRVWGSTYHVNGAEFLVRLVVGPYFISTNPDATVDMFMLSCRSGNKENDKQTEYHLNKIFVGKPVHELDDWYQEYQDSAVLHPKRPDSPWARVPKGSSNG